MQKLFICSSEDCTQFEVEFILTNPMPITTCGGCGELLMAQRIEEDA